jgi:hypothetical protein
MWKYAMVSYFKDVPRYSPGGTKENRERLSQEGRYPNRDRAHSEYTGCFMKKRCFQILIVFNSRIQRQSPAKRRTTALVGHLNSLEHVTLHLLLNLK